MTTTCLIETRPQAGVAMLRLARPQALNALNLVLRQELAAAFGRLDGDDSVRVIVLAGDDKAFCAGADLGEYVDADPVEIIGRDMGRLWDAVAVCRKPVIAAVCGYVLGGGCELAMRADLIVAGASARLGQPEVLIGLMPGGGATQFLPRVMGKFQAMKLLLTGEFVGAPQALQLGLVSEVVADHEVEKRALALAAQLAALPVQAVRFIKEAVLEGMEGSLQHGLQFERKSFQLLFATADKTEGIRARLEKRPAKFAAID